MDKDRPVTYQYTFTGLKSIKLHDKIGFSAKCDTNAALNERYSYFSISGVDTNDRAVAGRVKVEWLSYTNVKVKLELGLASVAQAATINTVINASVVGGVNFLFGGSSQYYEA